MEAKVKNVRVGSMKLHTKVSREAGGSGRLELELWCGDRRHTHIFGGIGKGSVEDFLSSCGMDYVCDKFSIPRRRDCYHGTLVELRKLVREQRRCGDLDNDQYASLKALLKECRDVVAPDQFDLRSMVERTASRLGFHASEMPIASSDDPRAARFWRRVWQPLLAAYCAAGPIEPEIEPRAARRAREVEASEELCLS